MIPETELNLDLCALEPIHIPGTVQPHGALLSLEGPELRIRHASENAPEWLGHPLEELLGEPLERFIPAEALAPVRAGLASAEARTLHPVRVVLGHGPYARAVNVLVHRQGELILLEMENRDSEGGARPEDHYASLQAAMTRFRNAASLEELCRIAAEEVRKVIGFDRVMIYRFDREWNGEVLAESLRPEGQVDSFQGLHFPASDIPVQARKMYELSWLRIIPDSRAIPARLRLAPGAPRDPLDLTFAALRSVSPVHLEYLANMGVRASMSISLLEGTRLWGLIACHHLVPRRLGYDIRVACEFLAQLLSGEVSARMARERAEARARQGALVGALINRLGAERNFLEALRSGTPGLLDVVPSTGAYVWLSEQRFSVGRAPSAAQMEKLVEWLTVNSDGRVFQTRALASVYPDALAFADVASGLTAIPLSNPPTQWLLWFRPELHRTVTWAGNPSKPLDPTERLTPRKSFAAWQQTVRQQSVPWSVETLESAELFRSALTAVVLKHAADLEALNKELERSNHELDAFGVIASHDLKEPLRSIQNYTRFIIEDAGSTLDAETLERLQTIGGLGEKMQALLDGLFDYSRVGRVAFAYQETDLQAMVDDVVDSLHARLSEGRVEVRIPRRLPTMRVDVPRVREVFANLIANAAKYHDRAERWLEVGYTEDVTPPGKTRPALAFYVKDNGIGIAPRLQGVIFEIFRRLHPQDAYGGGTGVGLAIVRQVVERHGGQVWVESEREQGSTFRFTLGAPG